MNSVTGCTSTTPNCPAPTMSGITGGNVTDLIMVKRLGALRPADDASEELMNSLPLGEPIKVKISRPRNLQQHRKFYALLQIVFSNQSLYPTIDALLAVIKITLGHCDIVKLPDGQM